MFEIIKLRLELLKTQEELDKALLKNIKFTNILIAAMQSDNPKEIISRKWKEMRRDEKTNR